jgi:K+-transporting ATPase A subunit
LGKGILKILRYFLLEAVLESLIIGFNPEYCGIDGMST